MFGLLKINVHRIITVVEVQVELFGSAKKSIIKKNKIIYKSHWKISQTFWRTLI